MMKFKKFLAAAMISTMTFGIVATAAPVINTYAEGSDAENPVTNPATTKVVLDKNRAKKFVAPGGEADYDATPYITYTSEKDNQWNGKDTIIWSVDGSSNLWDPEKSETPDRPEEKTYMDPRRGHLYIGTEETATKLTVKATSKISPAVSDTLNVNVFAGAVIDIDYEEMTADISSTDWEDSFVFLEVAKKSDSKPGTGTIYCYEIGNDGEVTVDLSCLKLSKDVFLYVYGNKNTKPFELTKIAKQDKKPSIKFKDGALSIANELDKYEYRTQNTEWMDADELDSELDQMRIIGTTLFMRTAGNNEEGKLPTQEVKVKIPATQKAPKVTTDYAKNTIKLPKKAEIRVPGWTLLGARKVTENGKEVEIVTEDTPFYYPVPDGKETLNQSPEKLTQTLVTEYIKAYNEAQSKLSTENQKVYDKLTTKATTTSGSAISDEEKLLSDLRDGCSILVRTNDTKKGASQPAFVEIKAAPVIAVKTVSGSAIDTVAVVTGVNEKGETQYGDSLKFEYGEKELTFNPTGTSTFSYSLDGTKFTKIKSGTKVKIDKITNTTGVIVRTEGKKEKDDPTKSEWASNTVKLPVSISKVEVSGDTEIKSDATNNVTKTYTAKVTDALGQEEKSLPITWKVNGANATFTVDKDGKCTVTVPANADGTIKITASCGGKDSVEFEVTVKKPEAPTPAQ